MKYPAQSGVQMNDMYSYTAPGTNGAGLPAAKRLQVNQAVEYTNNNNQREESPITVDRNATYTYNDEGETTAVTYPSTGFSTAPVAGASYNYSYDSMYRLSGMTTSTGTSVVSGVSYNAANEVLTMNYYGIAETRSYNVLNQLTNINVGSFENLTYNYPAGSNNGKISSMYNAISGETVTYTYDSLNRLLTANGSGWGQQYGFDSFGNLLSKTVTAGSGPSLSQAVNPANNQIVGYSYDANGNTSAINNGGYTYDLFYDPESRLSSVYPTASYFYDAQNRRIWSWANTVDGLGNTTSYTVNMYSPSGQKLGAYLFVPGETSHEGCTLR